jgi:hypothetical protein
MVIIYPATLVQLEETSAVLDAQVFLEFAGILHATVTGHVSTEHTAVL